MARQIDVSKIRGLELQSNSFKPKPGALEVASNVVLSQDDIISKKRGQKLFYDPTIVTMRNLGEYKSRLIGFAADRVLVFTQAADGSFSSVATLAGESFTVASGTKARPVESNGNYYFTTDGAIMKLESVTGSVLKAGIDAATDLQVLAQDKATIETFCRPDSQVSYRVVFGRKDANQNLVLGAPSQIVTTTNAVQSATTTISVATVTVTTTAAHGLAVSDSVYITAADGTAVPDGTYLVTEVPTATTFKFVANSGTVTTLQWGTYKTVTIEFAVPAGLNSTEYFFRIYRTGASVSDDTLPDESTLQLIEEQNLSSGQIATGFIVYKDEIPDILRGAYLYTNPNTGEARGIAEANERPLSATDLALFKGHVFAAGLVDHYGLSLSLISSTATAFPDQSELTIVSGATTRTYIGHAAPKVGNRSVRATSVGFSTTTVTITYVGHGFADGDTIAVAEALDSSGSQLSTLPQGNYTVAGATADTFDITAPAEPTGLVALSFQGQQTAAGKRIFYVEHAAVSSVSAAIDATARSLVRAVNRDASAPCIAYYTSLTNGIPGKMSFRSKTTTATFNVNSVSAAINEAFSPNLATTGTAVQGTREELAGVLGFAKPGEGEAWPFANRITVGSKSKRVLRIKPLRDSLIVVKEDGIFRVNGNDYSSFVATVLDSTVICKAPDSVVTMNNQVFLVSDQGVVAVSETSAAIVSNSIKPLLTAVLGKPYFASQTRAVSYESERIYLMTTVQPTSQTADQVYCLNDATTGWTTWADTFLDAIVKSADDRLYYIDLENKIYQERKNQNRLDYCGADYAATILTTPSDTTATLLAVGSTAAVGDIIVIDDIIHRIVGITSTGGALVYTFARPFSFTAGAVGTLYKGITSRVRFAPITGGSVSEMVQFTEFQGWFRNNTACSRMDVYFITDTVAGSETTEWVSEIQGDGWGEAPWGQFGWGQEEGTNSVYTTTSAPALRTYVPLEAQRATFIQPDLTHTEAAEPILLQSIALTARKYGQRTTR